MIPCHLLFSPGKPWKVLPVNYHRIHAALARECAEHNAARQTKRERAQGRSKRFKQTGSVES
jgi:hypothetical protein